MADKLTFDPPSFDVTLYDNDGNTIDEFNNVALGWVFKRAQDLIDTGKMQECWGISITAHIQFEDLKKRH